ncbi:MAG: hypothetical protein AAF725_15700 [Acidobacteriota bacterium]
MTPPSALAQLIPADFARRHLRTGRELARGRARQPSEGRFSSGAEAFDNLLGGGLERGAMHELSGRGGGRFSLVLSTLAAVTAVGEAAALIDLGDALDPQAADQTGVDLERLLWVRPTRLKEALACAEAILTVGMPLVILDLGLPPVPGGRGAEASWLRLARSAQQRRTALLISSPYRVSGTAAHSVVELRRAQARWSGRGAQPRLLSSLEGSLKLVKGPGWHGARPQSLELRVAGEGPRRPPEQTEAPRAERQKRLYAEQMKARQPGPRQPGERQPGERVRETREVRDGDEGTRAIA